MATCRYCHEPIDWALCDGRWVPLEPLSSPEAVTLTYVDDAGILHGDHRERCESQAPLIVTRLKHPVEHAD